MKATYEFLQVKIYRCLIAMIVASVVVAGCGDGGGETASASDPGTGGSSSSSPTFSISGSPPSQIMQDAAFTFTPTVSNPDNIALTFSATNLPSWASINASTGRITGTPHAADLGTYSNIRVTVAGGGQSVTSQAYSVTVVAVSTGAATLSWMPPTEKTDGSALTNLAGYKIYYGQSQNNLNQSVTISSPGITSYVISNLTPATWFFAATAYDANGLESSLSNVASKTIL